jgi:hypothetical protein
MKGMSLFVGFIFMVPFFISPSLADELESGCYKFIYPKNYISHREISRFADEADRRCSELKAFLKMDRKERIPVYVKEGKGISNTQNYSNRAIELYFLKPINGIHAPLIHETTHILIDSRIMLLKEGIAVAMEKRFGNIFTHPTYGFELDCWMKAIISSGKYTPLSILEKEKWGLGSSLNEIINYCESGSFCEYIIDSFGIDPFLRIIGLVQKKERLTLDRAMNEIFREGLEDLEKKWIENIKGKKVNEDDLLLIKEAIERGEILRLLGKRMEDRKK